MLTGDIHERFQAQLENSFRATDLTENGWIQRRFEEFHRDIRIASVTSAIRFVDFPVRPLILVVFDQSNLRPSWDDRRRVESQVSSSRLRMAFHNRIQSFQQLQRTLFTSCLGRQGRLHRKPVLGPIRGDKRNHAVRVAVSANDVDFRINPYQSIPRFCVIFCR